MLKKILFTMLILLITVPVGAAELLMFSSDKCGYCLSFLKEVEPTYSETKYGKVMPLNVINIDVDPPDWARKAMRDGTLLPIRATPTFVLWDNIEIVRTEGYQSKEQFYVIMDAFLGHMGNLGDGGLGDKGIELPPMRKMTPPSASSDRHNRQFKPGPPPEGVIDSRDLYQHMYQTAEEALKAAQYLGCGNNVHYHDEENVWMPCMMEM